jgi:hypothetical protein
VHVRKLRVDCKFFIISFYKDILKILICYGYIWGDMPYLLSALARQFTIQLTLKIAEGIDESINEYPSKSSNVYELSAISPESVPKLLSLVSLFVLSTKLLTLFSSKAFSLASSIIEDAKEIAKTPNLAFYIVSCLDSWLDLRR